MPPNETQYVDFTSQDLTGDISNNILTLKSKQRGGTWNDHDLNSCYNIGVPCRQYNLTNNTDWDLLTDIEDVDGMFVEAIQ